MSPPNAKAPEGAPADLVSTPNTTDSNRKSGKATQLERVLQLLTEQEEVCSSVFYQEHMPRFGARLRLLRERGWVWTKRLCDVVDHRHESNAFLYRLIAAPVKTEGEACLSCGGRLAHVSSCPVQSIEVDQGQMFGGLL
jgi:hypothetical protein